MRMLSVLTAACIGLLFSGCDLVGISNEGPPDVQLSVDDTTYAIGSTVKLTLSNNTDESVVAGANLCPAGLDKAREDGSWQSVPATVVCQLWQGGVASGKEVSQTFVLDADRAVTQPGIYRFTHVVWVEEQRVKVRTDRFEVRLASSE